jgi:16S rRNA (cytidine1402-2'-O)-methyltransferase
VATPIGNLGDITFRALETLKKVDLIACEDTRKTGILLKHYDISKPLISFHKYNEKSMTARIVSLLQQGRSVAVVTSSGTPAISDPGYSIVSAAIRNGIEIVVIPGPTAFVSALVVSGLPAHSFIFRGFPPHKPGQRKKFLECDRDSAYTLVYYESPHRLGKFLRDALAVFGDRDAAIVHDLTKVFETVIRGRLSELAGRTEHARFKGEYTVVIQGKD